MATHQPIDSQSSVSWWDRWVNSRWTLGLLVLVGLLLRLAALALWPAPIVSDAQVYERQGWQIAQGLGLVDPVPTAFYPPLYPYVIGGLYALLGRQPMLVQLVQAILSAVTSVAIYDIVRTVWKRRDMALVAAGLVAIDFAWVLYPRLMLTETLFGAVLAIAMVALARAWESDRLVWWAGFGMATAGAALARPPIEFLPLAVLASWLLRQWRRQQGRRLPILRRWLLISAVVLTSFIVTVAPWVWRNARTFGVLTPQLTSSAGTGLYVSYFALNGPVYEQKEFRDPRWAEGLRLKYEPTRQAEWNRSAYLTREVMTYLRAHPWLIVQLVPQKLLYLAWPYDWVLFSGHGYLDLTYVALIPFVLLGLWQVHCARQWQQTAPVWLVILYTIGMSVMFLGAPRYRMPIHPYVYAFAAIGLLWWIQRHAAWPRWIAGWLFAVALIAASSDRVKQLLAGL